MHDHDEEGAISVGHRELHLSFYTARRWTEWGRLWRSNQIEKFIDGQIV